MTEERNRMQKEIDRMRDTMNKTSGNLQGELAQRDDEINKLNKRVSELEKEI